MKNWLPAAAALGLVGLLAGCGDDKQAQPPPPSPPKILSFQAAKPALAAGESTVLSFTTAGATEVSLLAGDGSELPLEGDAVGGSATVTPTASEIYVLRARGEGGSDTAHLLVTVGEPVRDFYLAVVPPVVDSGEEAQLLWSAVNAQGLTLTGSDGQPLALDGARSAGAVTVSPSRTTTYTLAATGSAGEALSATAKLQVLPVLSSFTVTPQAAKVGEKMTFSWKTRGATEVVLKEALFGELRKSDTPAQADETTFEWTVPQTFPGGGAVSNDQPLLFTLEVKSADPALTLTRVVQGLVGDGPRIDAFEVPAFVTEGKPLRFEWRTSNAVRVELRANGAAIYAPAEGAPAVAQGSYVVSSPPADTTYALVAFSHGGQQLSRQQLVKVVKAPVIQSFTLPATLGAAGTPVTASWSVANAQQLTLRMKNGPALYAFQSDNLSAPQFANGQTMLYPTGRLTVVLEATNAANDSVQSEKSITVSAPANVSATPSPTVPGTEVNVAWNLGALNNVVDVLGVPSPVPYQGVALGPTGEWVELETAAGAQALTFDDLDDATVALDVPGFVFPFVDQLRTRFHVSTNGFVSFDSAASLPSNVSLPAAAAPTLVAPFWDDLHLGTQGEVLWLFDQKSSPRRLIVQWNRVELKSEIGASSLSFQVQLNETGDFKFVYRELQGSEANGAAATIGAHVPGGVFPKNSSFVIGGTPVQSDLALDWFSLTPVSGVWAQVVNRHTTFHFFGKLANGALLPLRVPVWVFRPGMAQLTEAMPQPEASVALTGAWVELFNADSQEVDFGGLSLMSTGGTVPYYVPAGTFVAPGGYLLLGQSTNDAETGGAAVQLSYGADVPLAAADTVSLQVGTATLSSLAWTASSAGVSVQSPEQAIATTGSPITCPSRTQMFGPMNALGTPGAQNETCFAYRMSPTTPNYRDISLTGVRLFAGTSQDSVQTTVDISAHPLPLFGRMVSQVGVTSNGYVTLTLPASSTYSFSSITKPTSSTPNESFVIFGDDGNDNADFADASVYGQWVAPGEDPLQPMGHWIVQWHHYSSYFSSPEDDLNFQIKAFENGVVEFHYGAMIDLSTTTTQYSAGESATVWVEDGQDRALPVSLQAPNLQSNTAFRFIPVQ